MALVSNVEWEACLLEPRHDRELERRLRKRGSRVPDSIGYFADCPWAAEAVAELDLCLFTRVHLESPLPELAMLVVSQDNSCRFCFAAQRVLLRLLGIPQSRISQLEQDLLTAELDPRDKAALEFARRVSRSNPLPTEADKKALREAGFSDLAIKELSGHVALSVFFNRFSTLPALPPERFEGLLDRWYVRLARPLLARRVRSWMRISEPQSLKPEEKTGPFSYAVLALDGLPLAGTLRRVLDRMWGSPILSSRCKALVFAVVARAIGCPRAARESLQLLGEEGLGPDEVEEILSHLASPKLDPIESLVLPLARETVWIQAATIQRHARTLQEAVSPAQFAEFIVVAALANAVCRLGIAIDTV
jgi:AhpD family alkylhydroperoxidase